MEKTNRNPVVYYHLIPAEDEPDLYRQLFALYCQDLQADDPTIADFWKPWTGCVPYSEG